MEDDVQITRVLPNPPAGNGTPPFIPPWLEHPDPMPDEPHAMSDALRIEAQSAFVAYTCDEYRLPIHQGDTDDDDTDSPARPAPRRADPARE